MKRGTPILLTCFLLIFYSCSKERDASVYESGIYKPFSQIISPIQAMTRNGMVDGSQIKITWPKDTIIGGTHFVDASPTPDPLREPTIAIDSIRLTSEGGAFIYPDYFNFSPKKIERKKDSLFLKPSSPGAVAKFSAMGIVLVTDSTEAELHSTQTGRFLESGFVLFSYNIYVKRPSAVLTGTRDANYINIGELKNQLLDGDTLVYVKKETYFKKS